MSKFKRPAIVSLAAIAGAQLSAIAFSPQPGQTSGECLQWAQDTIKQATGEQAEPERTDPMTYWDVRTHREERLYPVGQAPAVPHAQAPLPAQAPTAALSTPAAPAVRVAPVPLSPGVATPQPVAVEPASPGYVTGDAALDAAVADIDRAVDNGTYVPSNSGENVRL